MHPPRSPLLAPLRTPRPRSGWSWGRGCAQVLTSWLKAQPCHLSRGRQIWSSTLVPPLLGCVTLAKTHLSCLTESSSFSALESYEIMILTYALILPIILGAQPWFKTVLDKIFSLVHPWITFLSCCNLKEHLLFYFSASQAANIFPPNEASPPHPISDCCVYPSIF